MTNLRCVEGRILVGPSRRNRNTKCSKGDSCSRILRYHCSLLLGAAPHPPFHPTTTASQNQLPISGKGSLADISLNPVDVRFGSKADIGVSQRDVRFTPKSGHCGARSPCPLCAKSGHQLLWARQPTFMSKSAPIYRRAILPIHPIHFVALQITTDGNSNCREEEGLADLGK
jgi:hypothetical protein